MPFNVRMSRNDDPRPLRMRRADRSSALADSIGSFFQGALFAFGALFMICTALWIVGVSGIAGDPVALVEWLTPQ